MRYGILGDIHGNLEALETVVAQMESQNINEYLCMGDLVGYGANPEECVRIVRDLGALTVVGNHDHAALDHLDVAYFNQYAREAALWTREQLSEDAKQWLHERPFVEHMPNFIIVHGSLQTPELFNYVTTIKDAEFNFRLMDKPILFLGHSHQPLAFFDTDPMTYTMEHNFQISLEYKSIVNVGSVGQPRDEDPRAAWALYDDEAGLITINRVEYDIERAAGKILEAGLPQALALRLSLGK